MSQNIAAGKMFSHANRVFGAHLPITADVFITNFCNNNCPYCTYKRWELDSDAKYMTAEEFEVYLERLLFIGVKGLILTGGGEPTVNPDFDKITEILEKNHVHYGINTNFNKLKYLRPDYLKVSLDAFDEDSYEACRGVRRYGVVRENIQKYSEWKKKNSPKTALGIQKMVEDPDEAIKFYEANKDLDVDYMVFRPYESTNGKYYKDPENMEKSKNIVKTIKDLSKKDRRVNMNFKWDLIDTRLDGCKANWTQIALNEYGEVMYCCHKPYEIVGHIMDSDILEKKEKFVTNMAMCDVPCRLTAPTLEVEAMIEPKKDVYFI